MLYATGMTEADMNKAEVGIASVWYEGNPCNMHLNILAEKVKEGVAAAGLVGMRFNTIGVSDGISMGTDGMSYSLQSRDLIADSIETVMGGQWYDACIAIPGCDKNMPGCVMAMGRLNRPSLMIYGGTIKPGCLGRQEARHRLRLPVLRRIPRRQDLRRGTGRHRAAKLSRRGACGGMYTANTMASAIEALGMSLPYSSSTPAEDPAKLDECFRAGQAIRTLLEKDIKPRDIMTRQAFENAMVDRDGPGRLDQRRAAPDRDGPLGRRELTIDDFQRVSDRVPYLADLKPSGKYVMDDLHQVGGTPAVMKYLLEKGFIDGDCLTVTGKTLAENLAALPGLKAGQDVIHPSKSRSSRRAIFASSAATWPPRGRWPRSRAKKGSASAARPASSIRKKTCSTRWSKRRSKRETWSSSAYEGPKGGPGMPEMLTPTSAIMGAGLGSDVALMTDGRFSGGSHGFIVGHITPEAQEGGPIALVRDGDTVTIDAEKNRIDVDALRRRTRPPPRRMESAALQIHARHALQVHQEREVGLRRLRDRRVTSRHGREAAAGPATGLHHYADVRGDCHAIGGRLDAVKLGVGAAFCHQFVVAADLGDAGAVEDDDQVGHPHGRKAVRHQNRDPPRVARPSARASDALSAAAA